MEKMQFQWNNRTYFFRSSDTLATIDKIALWKVTVQQSKKQLTLKSVLYLSYVTLKCGYTAQKKEM